MSVQTNAMDLIIQSIKLQIHTSLPARVVRYYANTTPISADVEILFMQKGKGGQLDVYPMVQAVPVLRHVGPLVEGDVVLLSIAERSLDNLQKTPFDPDSIRMFSIQDAVVMGVFDL